MFFQLLSTIKVNLVAKIMQSVYLCVIFHVKHRTLPFLEVLTWFPILGDQDGVRCWWRHRPPAALPPIKHTSSCSEDQRLSTKGKIVSKYCNISKTLGRGSIHLLPLYHGGILICLYVRGLKYKSRSILRGKKELRFSKFNLLTKLFFTSKICWDHVSLLSIVTYA